MQGKVINDLRKARIRDASIWLATGREGGIRAPAMCFPAVEFVEQEATRRAGRRRMPSGAVVEKEEAAPKKEIPPIDPKKFSGNVNEITPRPFGASIIRGK